MGIQVNGRIAYTWNYFQAEKSIDLLLDTVGADHELQLDMLRTKGTLVVLGIVSTPFQVR